MKEGNGQKPLDLKGLVDTLRHVTTAVQVMPFIYVPFYIVVLIVYYFASDEVLRIVDMLFYVSPMTVFAFLVLSKLLRLCKWHRRAVALPLLPQIVNLLDYYVIDMSEIAVRVNFYIVISMAILLLIAAYNVFFR